MAHFFRAVPRAEIEPALWERVVLESSDAWLFHTDLWRVAAIEDTGVDRSFAMVNGNGVLRAVVGMHLARVPGIRFPPVYRIYNFRSGLARAAGMDESEKAELDGAAIRAIIFFGRRSRAIQVNWELPTMAPGPNLPAPSILAQFGFEVNSVPAKVVDLSQSEIELWKGFRKGCKSAIKKAEREGLRASCASGLGDVEVFSELHDEAMELIGAQPRAEGHFARIWKSLYPGGQCDVLIARLSTGIPVAGIMTMRWKGATYYHAAASAQAHRDAGGNTLLVHQAMLMSRARGDQTFHLGPTPRREHVDERTYLVGRFKNQFGGVEIPWRTASFFLLPGLAGINSLARSVKKVLKSTKALSNPGGKSAKDGAA